MSKIKPITIRERKDLGSGSSRRLRRSGYVPIVVTSHGETASYILGKEDLKILEKMGLSESVILDFKVEGRQEPLEVFIKDYQINQLTDEILHMDFFQVTRGEKITTNLGINYEGSPIGVKEGGILETYIDEVEITCLPKDLPAQISIDTSELGLHESIYADRLPSLEGVEYQMSPESVLVSVVYAQKEKEEESPEEEEEEEEEVSV